MTFVLLRHLSLCLSVLPLCRQAKVCITRLPVFGVTQIHKNREPQRNGSFAKWSISWSTHFLAFFSALCVSRNVLNTGGTPTTGQCKSRASFVIWQNICPTPLYTGPASTGCAPTEGPNGSKGRRNHHRFFGLPPHTSLCDTCVYSRRRVMQAVFAIIKPTNTRCLESILAHFREFNPTSLHTAGLSFRCSVQLYSASNLMGMPVCCVFGGK